MTSFTTIPFGVRASKAAADIGGQRVQQDSGLSVECIGQDGRKLHVVAVFDGHGRGQGEKFSQLAVDILQKNVSADGFKERFEAAPEATGREIFATISSACFEMNCATLTELGCSYTVEDGLIKTPALSRINGGTTGTVIFISDAGLVHTFNVGDSDAWLITGDNAVRLNASHAPDCESEYERIHAQWPETEFIYDYQVSCGRSRQEGGSYIFPRRPEFEGYYHKNVSREWACVVKVGTSSLAMTRALGDEPLRHGGIIAEPSYSVHQAQASSIVQVASDGFWDNIQSTEIAVETAAAIQKYGYDAEKLNRDWFATTETQARCNFGGSRDNMWGYTVVLEKM